MSTYERSKDTFIHTSSTHSFEMKSNPLQWYKRAEAFGTISGYTIFTRRMALSLRVLLDSLPTKQEGSAQLIRELATRFKNFQSIKASLQADLSSLVQDASLVDCGAGSGSFLGFLEWANLPYPNKLTLLEHSDAYFKFLKDRIEGFVPTKTGERVEILGKEHYDRHASIEHILYTIKDKQTGRQSEFHLVHADAQEKNLPGSHNQTGVIAIGVSKYYTPREFKNIIDNMQDTYLPNGGNTVFNTQGKKDILPETLSSLERATYRGLKHLHQLAISGRPTLHHFYSKADIGKLRGNATVHHNYGDSIVVKLLH